MKTHKFWKNIFSAIVSDADVLFEVLDARNPLGTRNYMLEDFVRKNTPHIQIYLILNKIDLIPRVVLNQWITYFKQNTDYGIFTVSALHNRGIIYFKKRISSLYSGSSVRAMIVGYPNTGKTSLISALTNKRKKLGISSRAGFTRGIMEIKIGPRISLLDSPGVIPISEDSELDQALLAVINPEKIKNLEEVAMKIVDIYISPKKTLEYFGIDKSLIKRELDSDTAENFIKTFLFETNKNKTDHNIKIVIEDDIVKSDTPSSISYLDFETLIELIGKKRGMLGSGGIVNRNKVYKTIIHAWQKNKIKYYILPPKAEKKQNKTI